MFFRTVYFVPYVISAAVAGKIWTAYMNPYYGLNQVFGKMGFEKLSQVLWLGDPKIALCSVAFVDNWHWWGFIMVLFLGALQQVDSNLYEAARVDGANRMQIIRHINIPGIMPTIAITFIMRLGGLLSVGYSKIYLLQNDLNLSASQVISTYVYDIGILGGQYSYSTAIGLFNNIVNIICLLIANKVVRRLTETGLF